MIAERITEWAQFYTASIFKWKPLLKNDGFKEIILNSLQFLVEDGRIVLNGFVIMNTHIHLIWQAKGTHTPSAIQLSFMRFTAQQMKKELMVSDAAFLEEFKVNKYDRAYQFWKREALGVELFTPAVFFQKLEYIHNNPVRAGLCKYPEDYYYSSARFYLSGIDTFDMLSHFA